MIEIEKIIEKLNNIQELTNSLYKDLFEMLINNVKYTDEVNQIRDMFQDKVPNDVLCKYVEKKIEIIKKIINNKVSKDDVIPQEPSKTKEQLLNATDYTELMSIYKKNLSEIKSDNTLETIYLYKKDEILYLRAKEVIATTDLSELENKWIKIYSTITKPEYLEDLTNLYNSRIGKLST